MKIDFNNFQYNLVNSKQIDPYDLDLKIQFIPDDEMEDVGATASTTCRGTCVSCGVTCLGTCIC